MLCSTSNQCFSFPWLIYQLIFNSRLLITPRNNFQILLLPTERRQRTKIVSSILFLMDRVFLLHIQYLATVISTSSSIIDFLFGSFRNSFDVVFYSILDSPTLWFWKYSECCEEFLCWGLGVCSTCLCSSILWNSSNLHVTLLLYLASIGTIST